MMNDGKQDRGAPDEAARAQEAVAAAPRTLPPAAIRALQEAEARRKAAQSVQTEQPLEVNGPRGPEPTRYGDWERKGVASDF